METPLKCCTACGNVYPATTKYFHANRQQADGLHCYCKPCRKARAHARYAANPEVPHERHLRYYAANREKVLESNRQWATENPDKRQAINQRWAKANPEQVRSAARKSQKKYRARVTEYMRHWRADNAEHYRAHDRQYRANNRERVREAARLARKRDPQRFRAYILNRRAQERNGPGITKADIATQYSKQDGRCYWCSALIGDTYHVDHFIPLNRQGAHSPDNIVIACPTCNVSKSDKLPFTEWLPPNPLEPESQVH